MNASIALWLYWHKKTARENRAVVHEMLQVGEIGRTEVRMAAVECALKLIQYQMN